MVVNIVSVTIPPIIALRPLNLTGVCKMDFLITAEKYAEARGDENYFKHWYTRYREYYNVEDSV